MQCKWAFLCLSLLSGIYVSAGIQTHCLTIPKHWAGQNMWIKSQRLVCMTRMTRIIHNPLCCCCCLFEFNVAFNIFSVISCRCLVATDSSMLTFIVLRHWRIMPQTFDMIPHPVTLSWHCLDQSYFFHVSLSAKREQLIPFLKTSVCRGPGWNLWPQGSRSGDSTYWATGR